MRVIGGQWSGRRLIAPRGSNTRPTSDRAREALFSILHDVSSFRVLDLFAGTGAVGIEALSRGAQHTTFVESDRAAAAVLQKNLEALGASKAKVLRLSVAKALERVQGPFDLIFADPPYDRAATLLAPVFAHAPTILAASGIVVAEQRSRDAQLTAPAPLRCVDTRRYGEATLVFFQKE